MIDYFVIFTQGGLVLWSLASDGLGALGAVAPVNSLVKTVLLEEKAGTSNTFSYEQYAVKWTLVNEYVFPFQFPNSFNCINIYYAAYDDHLHIYMQHTATIIFINDHCIYKQHTVTTLKHFLSLFSDMSPDILITLNFFFFFASFFPIRYGIVIAAVYQKLLSLLYVNDLISVVKASFVENYKDVLKVRAISRCEHLF